MASEWASRLETQRTHVLTQHVHGAADPVSTANALLTRESTAHTRTTLHINTHVPGLSRGTRQVASGKPRPPGRLEAGISFASNKGRRT